MEIHTIGIDIGKTVFNLVGLSVQGEVVVRKKFSRKQLLHFTANLRVGLIGMEACGGSHFLGRALRGQGHEVRLIPAQYLFVFPTPCHVSASHSGTVARHRLQALSPGQSTQAREHHAPHHATRKRVTP